MAVDHQISNFFSKYPLVAYRKGDIVIRPEDEPQGIYYIRSGYIRMYQVYENGKELTVNIFKSGSYFPVSWAISDIRNTYYFQTLTPVTINKSPKSDVISMLKNNPDMLYALTVRLISGFFGLMSNLERILSENACQRITIILVILATRFGKSINPDKIRITLSLTHEDIAQLAGLTRETASVELKKLMDGNLIFYKRRIITVNNLQQLQSTCSTTENGDFGSIL